MVVGKQVLVSAINTQQVLEQERLPKDIVTSPPYLAHIGISVNRRWVSCQLPHILFRVNWLQTNLISSKLVQSVRETVSSGQFGTPVSHGTWTHLREHGHVMVPSARAKEAVFIVFALCCALLYCGGQHSEKSAGVVSVETGDSLVTFPPTSGTE